MSKKSGPATFVQEAEVPEDRLDKLKEAVAYARDYEYEKTDLEARLKEVNIKLNDIYFNSLPSLFDEVGVTEITIEADRNMPAYKATASPYYRANIAAGWPDEKREAAFNYLVENGHGGLISEELIVKANRDDPKAKAALSKLLAAAEKAGLSATDRLNVNHATLTAWLKDMIENKGTVPPLDLIGATVGRVVKLKDLS